MTASAQGSKGSQPAFYRIVVDGTIRVDWSDWLDGMEISTGPGRRDLRFTTLTGSVADQAALRGILCRLWDLNLTLISVYRLEMDAGEKAGKNGELDPVF